MREQEEQEGYSIWVSSWFTPYISVLYFRIGFPHSSLYTATENVGYIYTRTDGTCYMMHWIEAYSFLGVSFSFVLLVFILLLSINCIERCHHWVSHCCETFISQTVVIEFMPYRAEWTRWNFDGETRMMSFQLPSTTPFMRRSASSVSLPKWMMLTLVIRSHRWIDMNHAYGKRWRELINA